MSDNEDTTCPLCMEEMDLIDRNFVPCPCGYRVCMWCWHHIRENLNGLCPACRVPYKEDPHAFAAVDRTEVVKKNKERKQKEKQERKVTDKPVVKSQPVDRRHLHNYRVIQRNLVYIIGVPGSISTEETLRKAEYFGQYGKISKIVIHRNHTSSHATVSAYITFAYKEDAKAAIQALEGFWLDGHHLRASFGTTKYCNNFIRGVPCNNPECVYLHELGEDEDRFTKEEIQAGHSKLMQPPGRDQTIVTGNGGPSGTGKKTVGEPVLPPPVFVQDIAALENNRNRNVHSDSPKLNDSSRSDSPNMDDGSYPSLGGGGMDSLPPATAMPKTPAVISSNNNSTSNSLNFARAMSNDQNNNTINNQQNELLVKQYESSPIDTITNSHISDTSTSSDSVNNIYNNNNVNDDKNMKSNIDNSHSTNIDNMNQRNNSNNNLSESSSINQNNNTSTTQTKHIPTNPSSRSSTFNTPSSISFNGFSNSAVFPVPISSLSLSIWTHILSASSSDLRINPFALIAIPLTELFEVTLPPVDATCLSPWPKPLSYYSQGIGINGQTHGPVAQHIYYRPTPHYDPSTSTPPQSNPNPDTQSYIAPQNQSNIIQNQNRVLSNNSQSSSSNSSNINSQQSNNNSGISSSNQNSNIQAVRSNSNNNNTSYTQSQQYISMQQNGNQPSIAVLQQMFPAVNMSYAPRSASGEHMQNSGSNYQAPMNQPVATGSQSTGGKR